MVNYKVYPELLTIYEPWETNIAKGATRHMGEFGDDISIMWN